MELSLSKLIDEEKLAALAQVYLDLRLPVHAALNAARADLVNLARDFGRQRCPDGARSIDSTQQLRKQSIREIST